MLTPLAEKGSPQRLLNKCGLLSPSVCLFPLLLFLSLALPSSRPHPVKEGPNRRPIHESPASRRLPRSPDFSTFPFSLCPLPRHRQRKGFWERKDCHCHKKGEKVRSDEFPRCAPLIWAAAKKMTLPPAAAAQNCTKQLTKHATELPILRR